MKSTITLLEQRVNSLESQVSSSQQPTLVSNNNQSQVNPDGAVEQDSTRTSIPSSVANDSTNISSIVSTFLNEEKERAKRRLNLIIHNVKESTSEDGPTRKKHDIDTVTSIFEHHLNVSTTITKAFRIGQHKEKPRLLKISVSTESEKATIL